jgi:GNAT superfamily N-acetyltransferase
LIFVALSEAADNGTLILVEGGMCRYHRRKDGVVVVREIIVLPDRRRQGVGRAMLAGVVGDNLGRTLRARCPITYPSNAFWASMGFSLVATEKGVNVWERPAKRSA